MPDRSWYKGFRQEWGHGNDHQTGWNKDWVNSLPDLLSIDGSVECYVYLTDLEMMPIKGCDAVAGCPLPADYVADCHGCIQLAICDLHLKDVVFKVNEAVSQGGAKCTKCGETFPILPRYMSWRVI